MKMTYLTEIKQFMNVIAISSLVCVEVSLLMTASHANPTLVVQNRVDKNNLYLPLKVSYDCGTAGSITLTQESNTNRERYTYTGVNSRGQTTTITNGVGYGGFPDADNYLFVAKDKTTFIIDDLRNGKATLQTGTGSDTSKYTTFNCTVISSQAAQSSSSEQVTTQTTVIKRTTITPVKPAVKKTAPANAVPALW
jgi:hypothetical protein